MPRVLRDGLYRDERPPAGKGVIALMYLVSVVFGALGGFLVPIAAVSRGRVAYFMVGNSWFILVLMVFTVAGALAGPFVLFSWRRKEKAESAREQEIEAVKQQRRQAAMDSFFEKRN